MYRWLVVVHVGAVLGFVLAHGASVAVTIRIRGERDAARVRTQLELSRDCVGFIHMTLLLVVITGIVLGFAGGLWGHGWIWASIIVLIAMWLAMYALGTRYYDRLRAAVGAAQFYGKGPGTELPPLDPAEVAALTRSSRPILMAVLGGSGLMVLVWLMIIKPF